MDADSKPEVVATQALAEARDEHLARLAMNAAEARDQRAGRWSNVSPWLVATLFVLAIPHTLPGIGLFVASRGKVLLERPTCKFEDSSLECRWETGRGTALVAYGWSPRVREVHSGGCVINSPEIQRQLTF